MPDHASIEELTEHFKYGEDDSIPPEDMGCDFCHFPTTELGLYSRIDYKNYNRTETKAALCDICACTRAGNAQEYPEQFPGERNTMQMLAYCTNQIIKAIKEK